MNREKPILSHFLIQKPIPIYPKLSEKPGVQNGPFGLENQI
jgi:hypothetical protein